MMFKNKKGISPLIATVLIIGFTVALAALIITWGGGFVRQTQTGVGEQTDVGMACTKMNFDVTSITCIVGAVPTLDTIRVSSNSEQTISGFILRATGSTGTLVDEQLDVILTGFDGVTLNWGDGGAGVVGTPTIVEVIGQVQLPGQAAVPCEAGIQSVVISTASAPTCIP